METEDIFSESIGVQIGTKGHKLGIRNWIDDGWVVINGENGKGVDLFFSLKKSDMSGSIIVTDQRKRVSGSLGALRVSDLIENARILPKNLGDISGVACLFSCFTSSFLKSNDIPQNSCLVSYTQAKSYHGSLWVHPAASPCIDINLAPESYLKMLFRGRDSGKLCRNIVEERNNKRKFCEISQVEEFIKENKLDVDFAAESKERIVFS